MSQHAYICDEIRHLATWLPDSNTTPGMRDILRVAADIIEEYEKVVAERDRLLKEKQAHRITSGSSWWEVEHNGRTWITYKEEELAGFMDAVKLLGGEVKLFAVHCEATTTRVPLPDAER